MKTQNIFKYEHQGWYKVDAEISPNDGVLMLRKWQNEAYRLFKNVQHMLLIAPTGSGKTLLMAAITYYKLTQNKKLKCIICAPQNIPATNFCKPKKIQLEGKIANWGTNYDFSTQENKCDALISWLKAPVLNVICDRVLVCTNATLVAAYNKLIETNQLVLLENLLLWADEAHHIKANDTDEVSNQMGKLIAYLLKQKTVHVGLATATDFRGDKHRLISEKMEEKFTRYELPIDT